MKLAAMGFFVEDLDVMVKFYRDVLNMKQNVDMDGFAGFVTEDGFFFNLCVREVIKERSLKELVFPRGINGGMQLSFSLSHPDEVDREYERLIEAGAEAVSAPVTQHYGLREAYVADPEGNLIEFVASVD